MAEVKLDDVREYGVEVSVETEQNNLGDCEKVRLIQWRRAHLSEVGVVDVSHHVEQQLLDSPQNLVKI